MSRSRYGYQQVANDLAKYGFTEELTSFMEKYRDKVSYVCILNECFDAIRHRIIDRNYMLELIDYYCENYAHNEKELSRILTYAIEVSEYNIATHIINLGAIPNYGHVNSYLEESIYDDDFFRTLTRNMDLRNYEIKLSSINKVLCPESYEDAVDTVATLLTLRERGYDSRTIAPTTDPIRRRVDTDILKLLIDFGTDFTTIGWHNYLISYFRMFHDYTRMMADCINDLKLLLDAGVAIDNDEVIKAINFHYIYLIVTDYERICYEKTTHSFSYVRDTDQVDDSVQIKICTFPTEALDLLVSYGLDLSHIKIIKFDGCVSNLRDLFLELPQPIEERVIVTEYYF